MKKILLIVIPILILIVSCAIVLGLVLAHKRSGYKSSAGKKEDYPEGYRHVSARILDIRCRFGMSV